MHESHEVLDLVNENDEVIGTVLRGEFNHAIDRNGYVRAAEAFIVNSSGELWVPRRTSHKTHAPNGLDFSVSEHVSSRETYDIAITRGFQEELKMTVKISQLEHIGTIPPADTMPWFAAIYLYRSDKTPEFNRDDFSEASWMNPSVLLRQLAAGEISKRGLAPAIRFLLSHRAIKP